MSRFAWEPDGATRERAQLTRFAGHSDFGRIYRESIDDVAAFTQQVIRFLDIRFQRPYSAILDLSRGVEWPAWCVDGELNISVSCLDRHPAEHLAIVASGETLTYGELRQRVSACAEGLRRLGITKGDAIAILLPMIPEAAVALLACARIGAVAVPLFSGFGPAAIQSRVRDVEAKLILTCESFSRRGKTIESRSIVEHAAKNCPSVQRIVDVAKGWPDTGGNVEPTLAEDPLLVLYTSGTTGTPKGILHTHCSFPVKAAQDMCFGTDVGAGTRICWISDLGWMMGPWLIYGATILGATMVLYDDAPDSSLWQFCEKHRVEVLGISPSLIRSLASQNLSVPELSSMRCFASTGEPWNPDPWWWLFEKAGRSRIPIINYSGGTEIAGGILMGNPLLPIKPCSFPAPCPGIDADVFDANGSPAKHGEVGELVIRKPWIGMARGFLHSPTRYLETYWNRWPGVWVHGDWAMRDEDEHWYILGRSDDTLKIAGKRVGPAEVESVLVGHASVVEAAAIGVPHELKGEGIVAFCVKNGEATAAELSDLIASQLGKPMRPERIHFVPALPKTRNGKVMRRVIRAAYLNLDPGDVSALENPATLDAIREANV